MRESIGGIQLFSIVVVLILLFSGVMALTINHSNAFTVKDKIVQIIEKYESFDITKDCTHGCNPALQDITEMLVLDSYRQEGPCNRQDYEPNQIGAYRRDGIHSSGNNPSSFCIYKIKSEGNIESYYYKVEVFYGLDIPILKSVFRLKVTGETKKLYK